jgi:hypothetical protein
MLCEGKEVITIRTRKPAQQGKQCHPMLDMVSAQQGWRCNPDNSKDACALRMATTPSWQGQQHQLDDSNGAIATGQQCYCNDSNDAWTAKTPVH